MDQLSEMLTAIRNAQAVLKPTVVVPFSDFKQEVVKIMEREGFLDKFEKKGKKNNKNIEISLKYKDNIPAISSLKRVSKPGQRIYLNYRQIRPVKDGYGIAIISTSKGLRTNREAKFQKVGGELICEIW